MAIILCDFDGTCIPQTPHGFFSKKDIGSAEVLHDLVKNGHKIVLWTCRNNSKKNPYNYHLVGGKWRKETSLGEATRWFREHGIPLDGVNTYLPGEKKIGKSLKPLADIIIDDTAIGCPTVSDIIDVYSVRTGRKSRVQRKTRYVDWNKVRTLLQDKGLL
jgi:hypothetical protein